jgi:DNA-binding transcriptional LysR family regulator
MTGNERRCIERAVRSGRLNLRFLETFVWVARLKSFSLAAEKLHSTQAAVSHRIATLERELGVRLLERDTRDVRLTPQGVDAFEHAERIVRLAAEFRQHMSNPKALRGRVRIGVIETIAYSWLPALIDRLSQACPEVVLELNADTSIDIAEHLRASAVDLGLLMGPVDGPGMINVDLCTYACLWVASPRLGIAAAAMELADLGRFPILSFPGNSKPHRAMVGYFQRPGLDEVRLHTASLATLVRMATDGIGVAALPATVIEREIADGTLQVLNVLQPFPPLSLHAAYLDADRPLPALIAGMAREVAAAYCRTKDPTIAW